MRALTAFPRARPGEESTPPALHERALAWRSASDADLPFLRELYAHTRADELAHVPWPEAIKRNFLDDQFALQHHHFVTYYSGADFLLIEHGGLPIGRLYAMRQPAQAYSVVDIALLPEWRGRGIGAALIRHLQQEASAAGQPLLLQVSVYNPAARRLYERLGFVYDGEEGAHQHMRWCGEAVS